MPKSPVLYLLPGLLCDQVTWAHQVRHLAEMADIRVPSFYGFSSLGAMADSVLLDAPPRFAVAGHSMGARVALEIIRKAPDRIERLALLDTGTHPVRPGEPEKRQELVDLARRDGMAALAAAWLPPMVHPQAAQRDPALMQTLTEMVCRATPDIFAGQIKALLDRPDAQSGLAAIRCLTLVGVGRDDAWSPVSQHEPIAAAIPGARLVVFENSGHMAPMEAPDAVTAALRDWLGDGRVRDAAEKQPKVTEDAMLNRRTLLAAAAAVGAAHAVRAADAPIKVGLILPMTGPFASTGREIDAACRLYLQQNPSPAMDILLRDDAGVADTTRRLAQELVVNDKVNVLAGFGLTPLALAAAPLATRAKVPMVVMAAATSTITDASPFIARTSQTVPQVAMPLAEWAWKNGIKKVVTIVSDYGPGLDAEKWFKDPFIKAGGQVPEALRVPLANPDFAPFLQRASDASPDAVFIFVPSGVGAAFMKQFAERGLKDRGIKLIGLGDVVDDELLNSIGDVALGTITSQHYSAAHDSPENHKFVDAFGKANPGMRPNFMAVGGWDGMALIAKAVGKAGAGADGQAIVEAMKGQAWESPRGPISIDPKTRDIVQNIYIRRAERVNGQIYNVEFDTIKAVHDPAKAA